MEKKCPECGSKNIISDYNTGEVICSNCGLVIFGGMIDKRSEWRAFNGLERITRSRVGLPTALSVYDKGLSTDIGSPRGLDFDAFGRRLSPETLAQMRRLRKWQSSSRVYSSTERNLLQAFHELDRLSDVLSIPQFVKEKAADIYRQILFKNMIRGGRSIMIAITAAFYAGCRISKVPRNLKEISDISLVPEKEIARYYRLILRELNLKMPIEDPVDCIGKIAAKLGISEETKGLAIRILRKIQNSPKSSEKKLAIGRAPRSLAAAILYIACFLQKEKKTQYEIATTANVTEVTLRNRCKELAKELGLKLPEDKKRKIY